MKESSSLNIKHMPNHFYASNELIHPGFATVNSSNMHKKEKNSLSNIFGWKKQKLKSEICNQNASNILLAYNTIGYSNNFNTVITTTRPINYIIDSAHLNAYQTNSQSYISNIYYPTAPIEQRQTNDCHFYPSTLNSTNQYLSNQKQRSNILSKIWEPLTTNVQSPLNSYQTTFYQLSPSVPVDFQDEITYSDEIKIGSSQDNTLKSSKVHPKQNCTCFTSNNSFCENKICKNNYKINSNKNDKKKYSKFGTMMNLRSKSSDCILKFEDLNETKHKNKTNKTIRASKSQSNLLQQNNLTKDSYKSSNKLSATINEGFLRIFRKSVKEPFNSIKSRKSILECDLNAYDLMNDKANDCDDNNLLLNQDLCKVLEQKHSKHEYYNNKTKDLNYNKKILENENNSNRNNPNEENKINIDDKVQNMFDSKNKENFNSFFSRKQLFSKQWKNLKQMNKKNQFNSKYDSTNKTSKSNQITGQGIKLFSSSNLNSNFNNKIDDEQFFSNNSFQIKNYEKEILYDKKWQRYDKYKNNFQELALNHKNNFKPQYENTSNIDIDNLPIVPDPDYDSDDSFLTENNLLIYSNQNKLDNNIINIKNNCEHNEILLNKNNSKSLLLNNNFLKSVRPIRPPPSPPSSSKIFLTCSPPSPSPSLSTQFSSKLSSNLTESSKNLTLNKTNKNNLASSSSFDLSLNSNYSNPSSYVKSILKKSISNNIIFYTKKEYNDLDSCNVLNKSKDNLNFNEQKFENSIFSNNYLNKNKFNLSKNNKSFNFLKNKFQIYSNCTNDLSFKSYYNKDNDLNNSKDNFFKPKKHVHFKSSFDDELIVEHINQPNIVKEDDPIYDDIISIEPKIINKFKINNFSSNTSESFFKNNNFESDNSSLNSSLSISTLDTPIDSNKNSCINDNNNLIDENINQKIKHQNRQFNSKYDQFELGKTEINDWSLINELSSTYTTQENNLKEFNNLKHNIETTSLTSPSLLKNSLINNFNTSIKRDDFSTITNKKNDLKCNLTQSNLMYDYDNLINNRQKNIFKNDLFNEQESNIKPANNLSETNFNSSSTLNAHNNQQQMSPSSSSSTSAYVSSYASSMYSSLDSSMYSTNQNLNHYPKEQTKSNLQISKQDNEINSNKLLNKNLNNQLQITTNQQPVTTISSFLNSITSYKVSRAAILHCLNKQNNKTNKLIEQNNLFDTSKTKNTSYLLDDSIFNETSSFYVPLTENKLEKNEKIICTHENNLLSNKNNKKLNNKIVIDVSSGNNYECESNFQTNDHIYEELECGYEREINIIENLNNNLNSMKKSIFEGASRDQILKYLEDAKERVEKLINNYYIEPSNKNSTLNNKLSSLKNSCHNIENFKKFTNRHNRVSNLSNTSTDSSISNILLLSLSSGVHLKRNDSGVGTETSKSSSLDSRISKSEACLTEILDNSLVKSHSIDLDCNEKRHQIISQEEQCTDCEQAVDVEPNEDISLMYFPLFCSKCEKRRTERKEIISEFVDTEFKYGRDLRIIREQFYNPMEIAGLLTREQLKCVFLNLDELIQVNSKFSGKLQDAIDLATEQGDEDYSSVNIGKIFMECCDMLNSFEIYCIKHASASRLLSQLEKDKEILKIFLRVSQIENVLLRRMNLSAFLMVPVQRVTKYPLLINRLYKVTPYHHGDRDALREVQIKVELHLEKINQQTKGTVPNKIWRTLSNLSNNSPSKRLNLAALSKFSRYKIKKV